MSYSCTYHRAGLTRPNLVATFTFTVRIFPIPLLFCSRIIAFHMRIYALSTRVICRRAGATDVPCFASPLEFVKHAEWLMRGAHRTLDKHRFPRCKCKYCHRDGSGNSANLKQSVTSRELRRVRARVLTQIGGDEVEVTDNDDVIDAEDDANNVNAEVATADPVTDHGAHAGGDGS